MSSKMNWVTIQQKGIGSVSTKGIVVDHVGWWAVRGVVALEWADGGRQEKDKKEDEKDR